MPLTRTKGRTLLLALLWALSLAALCVTLAAQPAALPEGQTVRWSRTLPGTGAWFFAAVALGCGYAWLGKLRFAFSRPRLWIVAVIASGVATLGESFAQVGTAALITAQGGLALLYFAGRVPMFYMGMAVLTECLSRAGTPKQEPAKASDTQTVPPATFTPDESVPLPYGGGLPIQSAQRIAPTAAGDYRRNVTATVYSVRHPAAPASASPVRGAQPQNPAQAFPTWGFALILFACWLPYLFAVWPGTVSNDSITQLAEIFGRKPLSNGNPVFQTGLVWLAVSAGMNLLHSADASIALYVCVQGALMAWLLGYALRRMAEVRAPGWLIGLSAALYAFCPIFPTFAFCMGKDTTFAMAVLWFTLMVWRAVGSKWPPMRTVAGLCLSAALCALLRNAGVALVGVTLLALLVWVFARGTRQWRAPLLALLATGLTVALLYLLVIPGVAAAPMPETENWSVPLQQVARTVASEPLTDADRAAIDAVMPFDQIQPAYIGELSDPVKALWRDNLTAEQKTAFFSAWVRLLVKYPATCLSATFHNSYGYLLPGYVSTLKPTFLMGMEGRTTLIDGAFDFTVNPRADALKATLQSLFAYAPFRLLTSPGGYGLLTLFTLAALMGFRDRRNALCVLPALLTLAGCLFSAVNGYYRYAMPLYFTAPVMLALVAQASRSGLRAEDRAPHGIKAARPAAKPSGEARGGMNTPHSRV